MKLYKGKPTTCQIGPVRASYAHVFKARKNTLKPDQPMEYSITMLIPKQSHKYLENPDAEINAIKDVIRTAVSEGFGDKQPKGLHLPIRDGDEGDEPKAPGYWYIAAKTYAEWPDGEPKNLVVVDGRGVPIGGGFGSGDWCKVKVRFKAFDKGVNKGITCYLEGVQWLYRDEPLGGTGNGTDASEFDRVEGADFGGSQPVAAGAQEYDPFADE